MEGHDFRALSALKEEVEFNPQENLYKIEGIYSKEFDRESFAANKIRSTIGSVTGDHHSHHGSIGFSPVKLTANTLLNLGS